MGQISEQDPGFLGVSFMFSALVQMQTAAFIGAKLDFRTTALVVEQCSSDCGQIERTEQVSVLPPCRRPIAYRERMQRLYKAVWGGNTPHKLVVAYRVPAFDLANQLCGPAVRTALRQNAVTALQQPVDVFIAAKALVEAPDDLCVPLHGERQHLLKGRNGWDQAVATMLVAWMQL